MKTILTLAILLLSPFHVVTKETTTEMVKSFDKVKRMTYLTECKANKQKDCHMKSFEKSVILVIKG
jgi:hypothetical protein